MYVCVYIYVHTFNFCWFFQNSFLLSISRWVFYSLNYLTSKIYQDQYDKSWMTLLVVPNMSLFASNLLRHFKQDVTWIFSELQRMRSSCWGYRLWCANIKNSWRFLIIFFRLVSPGSFWNFHLSKFFQVLSPPQVLLLKIFA